eukprot:g11819.t1
MACLDREGLEFGDKIIVPQTAFREVFLPYWMMQSLLLVEGARVELRSILRPPAATFVRFKPHDDTFLDLAARQHEGENFYLDTVEVRTFASSSASPNGEKNASSETTSEPTNVEGHVTRHSGNGNDERRDGIGNADNEDGGPLLASGGRRVRLVCLLGDLDLEVEFCAPHAPLPEHGGVKQFLEDHAAVQGEGLLAARIVDANDHNPNGHGSRSSMKDVSRSPDPSQPPACLVAGRHGEQPSSAFDRAAGPSGGRAEQQGLPWPLPAPARARKSCGEGDSASGVGPSRPRRTPGQLGIKPALPPPSLTAKCRAFSGKGASLLGEVARFPSDGKEGPDGGGGELPAAPAVRSTASSMMRSEGPAETGPQRWSVPVEACADGPRRLGEGAASETGGSRQARGRACGAGGSGAAAAVAEVDLDRRAEATPCVRCGRLVPTANLPLHELRCTSSRAARPPSSPPSGPPTTPDETTAASVAAPSASSRTEQPKAYTRGPGQPTAAAPSARLTCAFCGLVFRSAGPAAEHEQACGTRTERCDRCCGHVPRRDAESHRRPGGSCDAVIAAAEEHERLVLAAGRSLALNGCGSGGDGGGDGGGVTWRGEGGGLLGGRFDALLAEAVRSSKAASTALEDARVENYARLVEAGGVTPLAGTRGLVRSRPDGDHGRACSDRDCAGNHSEAGVEATAATAMGVVEGASPVAFTAPAEENLRKSPEQGVSAEPDGGLQATEEPGARAMDGSSRRRRQPAKTTPVLLSAAARAASLPDPSPPPLEIAIPSKERRFYAVRQTRHAAEEEAAAAAALQPSPVTTGSSENTRRASGSAPQTCRGRGPSADGISGTLEGGDTGHAVPTQARHTAPAASSNAPSAVGTREPLAEGGAAGVAGPRSRCLRSPAAFFPAGIHPPQSRRRKEAFALQGGTAVRHQQQQQQQQQQQYARTPQQAAPRKRAAVTKPHALTGRRRRLMGPPRRLGGIQRPSRLHHVPTSFPLAGSPPTETATVAAEQAAAAAAVLTPGSRPVREVLDRHDHRRHCREHSQESLRAVSPPAPTPSSRVALVRGGSGRGGTVSATRPPHASAAPASDISLSILGRNHGMGGNPRRTPVPGGGGARCGGAKTGEGSRRPGCGSDLAGSLKKEAGAGIGAWGKSYGVEKGEVGATAPAAAKAVATAVGVAPLKLRRRVNETRMLEPLVGR